MEGELNLVIDRGNTRTKLGWFSGKDLKSVRSFADDSALVEYFQVNMPASRAIISDTRGDGLPVDLKLNLLRMSELRDFPVGMDYDTPETLGADRIANVCAAHSLFPENNALVIDAGTCITFDLLIDCKFSGGAISPGITMRAQSMHEYTGRLPQISPPFEVLEFGRNTRDCLHSGAAFGAISEARARIEEYQAEFGELRILLTGGDSAYFENALKCPIFADANLTLLGLNEILLHQS